MTLIDTDHLTVLSFPQDSKHASLSERISSSSDAPAITVVSVAEALRGWLAEINRHQSVRKKIPAFDRLASLIQFFANWRIVALDAHSADQFELLRTMRLRLGTMDLMIAAIALARNALLLSANLSDFRKVPGLRVENWLT